MSGSEGSSNEGSSNFGSRFEPPKSSLESSEEEMLGDLHDHQTCLLSDEKAGEEHRSKDRALDMGCAWHMVKLVPRPKSQEVVFKIATTKRAKAEAIGCVVAIVVGEERRLLPHLPNIDPIFPLIMEHAVQKDNARKMSKALTKVVQLKDQSMERLKRRNDENLWLKKHNGDEFEDDTNADEQTQQGEDGPEDAEDDGDDNGGET
ncbi:hypothetical protein D8674_006097 [Pyrus ussuriensis x Pyrus communis]|uniref:Uncharacterized protein n=1 Tax=Pyrus ussuriensis x Pyrus communis TaxID=2448454 RepID=A0A5N5FYA4_9ROSA|nr:hypothetical protein D8674_006097 [Pyrus ussuriensis x Pyrus communis]